MVAHRLIRCIELYIPEVFIESVFDPSQGLSHVLFSTDFAGDAINQVGTSAADIMHGIMLVTCNCTGNQARLVEQFAISAGFVVAELESSLFRGGALPPVGGGEGLWS